MDVKDHAAGVIAHSSVGMGGDVVEEVVDLDGSGYCWVGLLCAEGSEGDMECEVYGPCVVKNCPYDLLYSCLVRW